jgi:hypothetical protein
MNRHFPSRTRPLVRANTVAVAALVAAGLLLAACSSSSNSTPPSKSTTTTAGSPSGLPAVLDAAYATSIGFPKTVQAAKSSSVTDEKGCSTSVAAAYEDAAEQTGLLSDVLKCTSSATASNALTALHKKATPVASLPVPKELGSTAFSTKSEGSEYLVVWQAGNNVAITALDVDVRATSTTTTFPPLTAAQSQTLTKAAVKQNSLYQ